MANYLSLTDSYGEEAFDKMLKTQETIMEGYDTTEIPLLSASATDLCYERLRKDTTCDDVYCIHFPTSCFGEKCQR